MIQIFVNCLHIFQFRNIFKNEPSLQERNDYFYLRWLIGKTINVNTTKYLTIYSIFYAARNFDLSRAEKMLRDAS